MLQVADATQADGPDHPMPPPSEKISSLSLEQIGTVMLTLAPDRLLGTGDVRQEEGCCQT